MTNSRPTTAPNRQKTVAKPQAIIVLGMHRSGTSALTRVLNLLGCALPGDLIEPNDSNELGHWEAADAVALNDRILASAGSKWDDWGPINADWRQSSLRDEMTAEVADLLSDHAKLGSLFALKDPRLCRIADVWLDAMRDAKVTPLIAMIIRNPTEVALSLESRDLMTQGYGQLLWLRHVLDSEYLSRGQRRVVVTYDQLLGNWFDVADRIKTGLGVAFPRNSPAVHMEIEAFLSPMHRHHQEPVDKITKNPGFSEWLRRTLAIMLSWTENGENDADYRELDEIRREFDRSYTAFARLLIQEKAAGEVGSGLYLKQQLTSQIAEAQQASALAQASIQEAEGKLAAQAAHEAALTSQLQGELERVQQLQSELAALHEKSQQLEVVNVEAENLRAAEQNLASQIAQLEAALAASNGQAEGLQAEVARLQAETQALAEVQSEAKALRDAEAELSTQIAQMQAALDASAVQAENSEAEIVRLKAEIETRDASAVQAAQLEAEVARLSNEIEAFEKLKTDTEALRERAARLDSEAARLQEALDQAEKVALNEKERRIESEGLLQKLTAELEQQSWKAEEYKSQAATTKSTLTQREEELAQLWKQLLEAEKASAVAQTKSEQEVSKREEAEQAIAELRRQVALAQEEQSLAAERLAAEVAMTTRLLRDENITATTAQKAQATAEAQLKARELELVEALHKLRQVEDRIDLAEGKQADAERKISDTERKLFDSERKLSDTERKLSDAERRLSTAERKQAEGDKQSAVLAEKLQRAEREIEAAQAARVAAERKLTSRFDEIARLTSLLSTEAAETGSLRADAEWLREVANFSRSFPKWWALLPTKWRRKKEHARYRRRDLFDAQQYLSNNPDVANENIDPLVHYILHGSKEGRTWRG